MRSPAYQVSTPPAVAHNGSHFLVVVTRESASSAQLMLLRVAVDGAVVVDEPVEIEDTESGNSGRSMVRRLMLELPAQVQLLYQRAEEPGAPKMVMG